MPTSWKHWYVVLQPLSLRHSLVASWQGAGDVHALSRHITHAIEVAEVVVDVSTLVLLVGGTSVVDESASVVPVVDVDAWGSVEDPCVIAPVDACESAVAEVIASSRHTPPSQTSAPSHVFADVHVQVCVPGEQSSGTHRSIDTTQSDPAVQLP